MKYHQTPCYKSFTKGTNDLANQQPDVDEIDDETTGDFKAVKRCINEQVILQTQAVSMLAIHEIYGIRPTDTGYPSKLMKRIQSTFPQQLHFVIANQNTAEIQAAK